MAASQDRQIAIPSAVPVPVQGARLSSRSASIWADRIERVLVVVAWLNCLKAGKTTRRHGTEVPHGGYSYGHSNTTATCTCSVLCTLSSISIYHGAVHVQALATGVHTCFSCTWAPRARQHVSCRVKPPPTWLVLGVRPRLPANMSAAQHVPGRPPGVASKIDGKPQYGSMTSRTRVETMALARLGTAFTPVRSPHKAPVAALESRLCKSLVQCDSSLVSRHSVYSWAYNVADHYVLKRRPLDRLMHAFSPAA